MGFFWADHLDDDYWHFLCYWCADIFLLARWVSDCSYLQQPTKQLECKAWFRSAVAAAEAEDRSEEVVVVVDLVAVEAREAEDEADLGAIAAGARLAGFREAEAGGASGVDRDEHFDCFSFSVTFFCFVRVYKAFDIDSSSSPYSSSLERLAVNSVNTSLLQNVPLPRQLTQ